MRTAITLRNVVGETKDLLVKAAVPLHRDLNAHVGALIALAIAHRMEGVGVQNRFVGVDEFNKAFDAACA